MILSLIAGYMQLMFWNHFIWYSFSKIEVDINSYSKDNILVSIKLEVERWDLDEENGISFYNKQTF